MRFYKYLTFLIWWQAIDCASNSLDAIVVPAIEENPTPIVGLLVQEIYPSGLVARTYADKNYTSYIAASYIKFIEGAGGRVVPIWIGEPRAYYEDMLSKINGVLLPGGAVFFNNTAGYAEAGEHIISIARSMNDQGIYMPIWGTCLGMELLVYVLANHTEARVDCNAQAQALPLEFKDDFRSSRLFAKATDTLINIWRQDAVTVNWHIYCYTEQTFAALRLNDIWRVLSVNHDWNGLEYISSIEHKVYPFYGVQFHPEKNLYEFVAKRNITHTPEATYSSQYFANFFVNEARKNTQKFKNRTEEMKKLIFNYKPEYTAPIGSSFVQQYLFPSEQRSGGSSYLGLHAFTLMTPKNYLMFFGISLSVLLQA